MADPLFFIDTNPDEVENKGIRGVSGVGVSEVPMV